MKKILLVLILLALCLTGAAAEKAYRLGQPFPDFTVTDTEGNTFTLSEALRDHEAVLINFWASWCPPCRAEMPYLNAAYEKYGDRVAFIALSVETSDSMAEIKAFRQKIGVSLPMGRDENASLYESLGGRYIPMTVIVDRFGNIVYKEESSFFSTQEVLRLLEAFMDESYAETAPLTEIPKASDTRAFPVSAAPGLYVENENAKPVVFRAAGETGAAWAYVIDGDTARVRLEATANNDPAALLCYDGGLNAYFALEALLDAQHGAYVYDAPMPGAEADIHYTYIYLVDADAEEAIAAIYLIADDSYIEELADALRSTGYSITWEYAESAPAESAAPEAYILHVADQNGAAVPGVMVAFCTDTACTTLQSDENGTVVFNGAPDRYHVQLLKTPDGYGFDPEFELYTDSVYSEWILRVRKDER